MKNPLRPSAIPLLLPGLVVLLVYWTIRPLPAAQRTTAETPFPKYVFLFLVDGGGIQHLEITRQYNRVIHNAGLVIVDKIIKPGTLGLLTTHAANSLSTDSAAAATALASGCKANIGALSVCADGTIPKTALEMAKDRGMRIGLVTNSTIYDASPAAFACHVKNRRDYRTIVDCYLKLEPELLLGGGKNHFLPKRQHGSRHRNDADMIEAFRKKGYLYAVDKTQLQSAKSSKVLGLFADEEMSLELDRDTKTEPSVYDMTQAAIRLLHSGDFQGFFLFVETENIDTAAHLSDVASVIRDYLEFDRAVGLAYEFYRQYPRETLIIVTSDHDTGGLGFTMALRNLDSTLANNRVAATEDDLRKIHSIPISLKRASAMLGPHPTAATIDRLMSDYFSGFTLAPDIKAAIVKRQPLSRTLYLDVNANALGMMVANNTQAYWESASHTNQPVFVAALGAGAEKFAGYQDNTDFGRNLKAILQGKKTR
jgi:alkaline phosphatase